MSAAATASGHRRKPERRGTSRICWFADLEVLSADLSILERLRDEIGLTTLVPESRISHTSGFRASVGTVRDSPFEDWPTRPGLVDHREIFGTKEPAMPVLPGVVGGVDDGALLEVIEACRRIGLEVWGHAGLWSYGAEIFPEYAAVDIFGRPLLPASLPWGTMFCPSRPDLNAWIATSLSEAARRYDLDGWFLDHARYPTPAFGRALLACGCQHCAIECHRRGLDIADVRSDATSLAAELQRLGRRQLKTIAESGPAALVAWLARWPAVQRWLEIRATILADRFSEIATALARQSPRHVEIGCDVFPPSVAILGGHDYARWSQAATYLTGGFTEPIGWSSVGRVMARTLAPILCDFVPGMRRDEAASVISGLIGAGPDLRRRDDDGRLHGEILRVGALRGETSVYPPIARLGSPDTLKQTCDVIVEAGLQGAMIAGLEAASPRHRAAIRSALTDRLDWGSP